MDHKERFYATIERKPVDRPATWLGLPTTGALPKLFNYFKVNNLAELKKSLSDDVWPIELPYHSPKADAIYMALDFSEKKVLDDEHRTLNSPGFFENYDNPERIDDFNWPDPSKYIDPILCKEAIKAVPKGYASLGVIWSADFQDACAAFGMETALIKIMHQPQIFEAVLNRINRFYLNANEIFFEAVKGHLDSVLIGNDFGSQNGLMVSPEILRKYVFPYTKKLVDQAHSYDLKVIFHSCGSIFPVIGDLIDLGVDAIHPIQAMAKDMNPEKLKENFGNRVSFCGGIDAQNLLVNGSPDEIKELVVKLKTLFPTGLIISPSHEAILADIPPQNIEAIFRESNYGSV